MHIQDGLLDLKTCTATTVVSAGFLGYALRQIRLDKGIQNAPLMGVVAACLFAAQMLNFPIPGGTSGHLLGGVLAAVMLGPWSGLVVVTVVLTVQCLLMQDGGITVLGANVLNVGVIGCTLGYTIAAPIQRLCGGQRGIVIGAVLAAWFAVMLGAATCAFELAVSGTLPLPPTLGIMLLVHSMIGLGESVITGLALVFVLRTRPDLVHQEPTAGTRLAHTGQLIVGGLAIAMAIAILLSPFASPLPDGLDATLERLGVDPAIVRPILPVPMPDYKPVGMERIQWAGSIAGGVGTLAVFGVAFLVSLGLRTRSTPAVTPHAS